MDVHQKKRVRSEGRICEQERWNECQKQNRYRDIVVTDMER